MRKPLVAGNWKMNMNQDDVNAFVSEILEKLTESKVEVMIAPPAIFGAGMRTSLGDKIGVGVQDISAHDSGAYTGEISAEMVASASVQYAIIGHSERRTYHGENDHLVNTKINSAIKHGLVPVYCCGEKLDERESGNHMEVVVSQISEALQGFSEDQLKELVVAYEPVWAIGTGKTATSDQAQEMHEAIRNSLSELFSQAFADKTRILYGGSCKPSNAAELFGQPDVDGGLIGGASLKVDDFLAIVEAAK